MLNLVFAQPIEQRPAPREPGSPGVHVWRDLDDRVIAWGHSDGADHWMHWPNLASFHFTAAGTDITAFPIPGASADIIADTCLRSVVPMALQALGYEALHASAVLGPRGVVAFCARSHTGKSTLAFGLARLGYPQCADDAVVLDVTSAWPVVSLLPFSVRLRPESAFLYDVSHAPPAEPVLPDRRPAPLAAICILERQPGVAGSRPVEIEGLKASEAFVALLAHAYCFDPAYADRKANMLEHYLDIAARVPIYRLTLADDLACLPYALEAIARFIDRPDDISRRPGCAA